MDTKPIISFHQPRRFPNMNVVRIVLSFSIICLAASQAAAQYGGGGGTPGSPGYTPPAGGYSSAKGAAIGAGAAAGVGALFLALHYRGRLTGCVQPGDDGMRLVDEKNNKTYALVSSGVDLRPGQRVELKGHKSKSEAGSSTFEAHKLLKELGSCGTSATASSSYGATR
jgi:hypothetical protein